MRDWNCVTVVIRHSPFLVLILPMRDWNKLRTSPSLMFLWVLILPMRDWNRDSTVWWGWACAFWSYLWGIEMRNVDGNETDISTGFWSYLWGIEITYDGRKSNPKRKFWSYLWGIEINAKCLSRLAGIVVLILPMRDWNSEDKQTHSVVVLSFDLTYEGLKFPSSTWKGPSFLVFWSYLWGIEIRLIIVAAAAKCCFDLTYEGLK